MGGGRTSLGFFFFEKLFSFSYFIFFGKLFFTFSEFLFFGFFSVFFFSPEMKKKNQKRRKKYMKWKWKEKEKKKEKKAQKVEGSRYSSTRTLLVRRKVKLGLLTYQVCLLSSALWQSELSKYSLDLLYKR
jgi:hypothetical protein